MRVQVGLLAVGLICLSLLGFSGRVLADPDAEEALRANRWPSATEEGTYQARLVETGKLLWEATWKAKTRRQEDWTLVEVRERGAGQPWGYEEPVTWEKWMIFQVASGVQMGSLRGQRWTLDGRPLSELEVKLDADRRRILYRDTGHAGSPHWQSFRWTPLAIPDEFLFHWARTLDFDETPAGECVLLVSPRRRFRILARVRGEEEVTTPAGVFPCHRVELAPRGPLGLLLPLKILIPKLTLWCTVEPPHFWVRYEGPVGGPGSPRAVIELVDFKQGDAPR